MKPLANNKLMVLTKHVLRFILPPPKKKIEGNIYSKVLFWSLANYCCIGTCCWMEKLFLSVNLFQMKNRDIPQITLVNKQNVSVTKIVDSSSIQCAEIKYGLRIQF